MSNQRVAITASSLAEGDVVFRAGDRWVLQLADADLFADAAAADPSLAIAKAEVTKVVDVYPIEVSLTDDGYPVPKSYRERIRALGPPVQDELGKQAQGGPAIEAIAQAVGGARSSGRLSLIRRK
jgi:hypothetical protein